MSRVFAKVWQNPTPGRKSSILYFANDRQNGPVFAKVRQNHNSRAPCILPMLGKIA